MPASSHAVFEAIRQQNREGPAVVAHRGDSSNFAENTLPAFQAAYLLGVKAQEFDVRRTRDGVLLCIHDDTFDRTTDSAVRLGPGALVAETTFAEARGLDASAWRGPGGRGARIPSLAEVLDLLLPSCIAMIEHKSGAPDLYLEELGRRNALPRCLLQSFDWDFVAAARRAEPGLALALLGPNAQFTKPDAAAIDVARNLGAGMLHWRDRDLHHEDVVAAHEAGLLVCTYTTDEDVGFLGGAAMELDAMCTNRPGRMMQLRQQGLLRRLPRRTS